MRVAVIGGGFTGLACATELARCGLEVALYERNEKLGGLAAGFQEMTWNSTLEFFYHHWFRTDKFVLKYAKIWQAEEGLEFKRPSTVIQTDQHDFVQLDSAKSLLQFPELGLFDKLRMGAALAFLKIYWNWHKLESVTAEDWCRKYMGDEGFDRIWRPLLVGKYGLALGASQMSNCRVGNLSRGIRQLHPFRRAVARTKRRSHFQGCKKNQCRSHA
jgi:protoporphyrinogen oxidase